MDVEKCEWVGIILPNDERPGVVLITPLAFRDEGPWDSIARQARRQCFPNNGKVAVFRGEKQNFKTNQLYQFSPEENPRAEDRPDYARYWIPDPGKLKPAPLVQVLDWTHKVSSPAELPDLLDQELAREVCVTQNIYIKYQNSLYGPVLLDLILHKPRAYVQSTANGGPPLLVSVYAYPDNKILSITDEEGDIPHPLHLLDPTTLGSPQAKADWSLPQAVIKRVLKASNDALAELEEDVRLVDKRISDLARLSSPGGPVALRLEPATLERARTIITRQQECLDDLYNLSELIVQLPAAQKLVEKACERDIQQRSEKIAREATARAQDEQRHLQQLQHDRHEAEANLARLQEELAAAKERHHQMLEDLKQLEYEMQQRLERLRQEPVRVLADLHMTASLLPAFNGAHGQNGQASQGMRAQTMAVVSPVDVPRSTAHQSMPADGLLWNWSNDSTAKENIPSLEALVNKRRWVQAAQQAETRPPDVQVCAAALLAGLIPATTGPQAISSLHAVAQVIAGGRVRSVPIPLTALTPLDLLGTVDPYRQSFVPAAGGLADIILWTQAHPDELALAILEGIDRVPGLPVYGPLLNQYLAWRRIGSASPVSPAPINLFHPSALASHDPYRQLAEFLWPRNLLLAVTCDNDTHSLPLPAAYDAWFMRFEPLCKAGSHVTAASIPTQVSATHWQEWERQIGEDARRSESDGGDHADSVEVQRLYEAFRRFNIQNPEEIIALSWPQRS